MPYFDPEFNDEHNFESKEDNLDSEISRCRNLVVNGNIFESSDTIEDVAQLCIDNEKFEEY